jgi:2-amino-4-hydroxy-6-hydroxymethyldihydropteridine diphosphokinase
VQRTVWLGLGSNLGDRAANLAAAVRALAQRLDVRALSGVYETAPVGFADQPDFWNMVVAGRTRLEPAAFLAMLKDLEPQLGRTATFHMGPRVIDIDILLYGDEVVDTPTLAVPHAGLRERAFVLRPLLELDAGLTDPRDGSELAGIAVDDTGVRRIGSAADVLPLADWRTAS